MATEDLVEELTTRLSELCAFKGKDLIRRQSDWGTKINFEAAEADINNILDVAGELLNLPLTHLTNNAARQISEAIPLATEFLQSIDQFSIEDGNVTGNRDALIYSLRGAAENLLTVAGPQIPYLAYRQGEVSGNIAKLSEAVQEGKNLVQQANSWAIERKLKVDEIVKAAQDAAASAGVSTFTQQFDSEASNLKRQSYYWLSAAAFIAIVTILASILFYSWPAVETNASPWNVLQNVVSKLSVIAVLFTATVWCGRICRALMHQATVNRHRALSLKTFQAFVKSTDDQSVKDAVLMAATNSVFGNVPTGLVEPSAGDESAVRFTEINRPSGASIGATTE